MNIFLSQFTISLTLEAHRQAEEFRRHQTSPQRAKQVYLNSLAMYATRFYLECLGYELDLAASDGLNPVQQMLLGTAALAVKGYGQVECCPVVRDETEVAIAPQLHQDRLGYIAVHLDDSLRSATLLGFTTVAANHVAIQQLQPMDTLSELLSADLLHQANERITQLSTWLQGLADDSLQTFDNWVNPATPAFRRRSVQDTKNTGNTGNTIVRTKQIHLTEHNNQHEHNHDITLAMGLASVIDSQAGDSQAGDSQAGDSQAGDSQVEIQIQLYATPAEANLPSQLTLSVLDADNQAVIQTEAADPGGIQLKFIGTVGEQFSLQLELQDASFTEKFII